MIAWRSRCHSLGSFSMSASSWLIASRLMVVLPSPCGVIRPTSAGKPSFVSRSCTPKARGFCSSVAVLLTQPLLHADGPHLRLVAGHHSIPLLGRQLVTADDGLLVTLPFAGVLLDVLQQSVDRV